MDELSFGSDVLDTAPQALKETNCGDSVPMSGVALCLSGGGYRAMLFHLGALWRLNEIGYLTKIDRISSVSGGSIVAAVLGLNWDHLAFNKLGIGEQFKAFIVEPIRRLSEQTIDISSIVYGTFSPKGIGNRVAATYRKYLFHDKTLQDLPDSPRFVINATNVQSGSLWRFMKPYMRDYRVGEVKNPTTRMSVVVAASSAFPPLLSPIKLDLDKSIYTPDSGSDLQREPFTTRVVLTDGGVYDNLGLETAWKGHRTLLVSDAGSILPPQARPQNDWIRHMIRGLCIIDSQVRNLRKRQLLDAFKFSLRHGAYWSIRTNIDNYKLKDSLACPFEKTSQLASIATRLKRLSPIIQERLINWGYAVCDAAMRKYVDSSLVTPFRFPYPNIGVG